MVGAWSHHVRPCGQCGQTVCDGIESAIRGLPLVSMLRPHHAMKPFALLVASLLAVPLFAQNDPTTEPAKAPVDASQHPTNAKSTAAMLAKYSPMTGTVKLGNVAELRLADGWAWLAGSDGRRFLTDLGNRPGQVLGVAFPADFGTSGVFAVYTYEEDGHIADDENPDWNELLASMQESTREESAQRKKDGFEGVELLGWAEPPHYDKAQHKMYWAERLKFEGNDGETLNYNTRVLGRTGHLVVNGVGDIGDLALVAAHSKALLQATDFVPGKRYQDFDPAYDKVAAYGIGGLVAGKLALKVGLFAKLALLLKAFLKPILVGVVVLGGLLVKLLRRRQGPDAAPLTERGA